MNGIDTILILAKKAADGGFQPADVHALQNMIGAKEYLLASLELTQKSGEAYVDMLDRVAIAASALGAIGTMGDAKQLNAILSKAIAEKLEAGSVLRGKAGLAEVLKNREEAADEVSRILTHFGAAKAKADLMLCNILEAMVKLGAFAQAKETIERVSRPAMMAKRTTHERTELNGLKDEFTRVAVLKMKTPAPQPQTLQVKSKGGRTIQN